MTLKLDPPLTPEQREIFVRKIQPALARVYCLQRQDGFLASGSSITAADVDKLWEELKDRPMFREMAEVAVRLLIGDEDEGDVA